MTVGSNSLACTKDSEADSPAVKDRAHLGAMRHYGQLATEFAKTWNLDADEPDRITFRAISYCLGIIGGAACQVSAAAIPRAARDQWARVTALRNRIITEYRTVTPDLVFDIIQKDLPPLVAALGPAPEAKSQ